jgi:hypothetical protein
MLWRLTGTLCVTVNANVEISHPVPSLMLPPNLKHFVSRNLRCLCALLIKHFFGSNGVSRDVEQRLYEGIPFHLCMNLSINAFFMKYSKTSQWCGRLKCSVLGRTCIYEGHEP